MSFPAYDAIGKDIGLGFATWRVYMHPRPPTLDFVEPRDVKVWFIAEQLRMSPRKVIAAFDWLTERGYLIECGRDSRKVRSVRLAWDVAPEKLHTVPKCQHPPAA